MDISKLIRNGKKIRDCLIELPDNRLVTKKELKIYVPVRFEDHNLAFIGSETKIVGIYAVVLDNEYYAVSNINAYVNIDPTSTTKVTINDEPYYEFSFDAGSTVIKDLNLLKVDTLVYSIYDELIAKGRVPWYINYADFGMIFDTARYHAGANVGNEPEVTEMLISLISRDKTNRHMYYRQVIKNMDDINIKPPAFISLKNVIYAPTNTTNKLAGSYFDSGLVSALVTPAERKERIETILAK